jgi:hypothetical protein
MHIVGGVGCDDLHNYAVAVLLLLLESREVAWELRLLKIDPCLAIFLYSTQVRFWNKIIIWAGF